jgi:hypothetical protein
LRCATSNDCANPQYDFSLDERSCMSVLLSIHNANGGSTLVFAVGFQSRNIMTGRMSVLFREGLPCGQARHNSASRVSEREIMSEGVSAHYNSNITGCGSGSAVGDALKDAKKTGPAV